MKKINFMINWIYVKIYIIQNMIFYLEKYILYLIVKAKYIYHKNKLMKYLIKVLHLMKNN